MDYIFIIHSYTFRVYKKVFDNFLDTSYLFRKITFMQYLGVKISRIKIKGYESRTKEGKR